MDQEQRDFVGKTLNEVMVEAAEMPRKTLELKYSCAVVNQHIVIKSYNEFIEKIREIINENAEGDLAVCVDEIEKLLPNEELNSANTKIKLDVIEGGSDNSD